MHFFCLHRQQYIIDYCAQKVCESTVEPAEKTQQGTGRARPRRVAFSNPSVTPGSLSNFKPRVIPKSDEERKQLKDAISSIFLFRNLTEDQIPIFVDAMERKTFKMDDWIIRQGDSGDELYVVTSGICHTYIKGVPQCVKVYHPGEFFGELALMYNTKRAASIQAASDEVVIWALDRDTFRFVMTETSFNQRQKYEAFLSNVHLLKTLNEYERSVLADALHERTYSKGEDIIRAGDTEDQSFYILERGTAVALKKLHVNDPAETEVMRYKTGDYFGELALLSRAPRAATVRATSADCRVLFIQRDAFERLLGPVLEILERDRSRYDIVEQSLRKSSLASPTTTSQHIDTTTQMDSSTNEKA